MFSSQIDMSRRGSKVELPPYLTDVVLDSHAAYDQLEADFRARHAVRDLVPAYEYLRARRPKDVLLAVRSAMLQLETKTPIQQILPIVDAVRELAPDAPDTHYLVSLVTRVLFYDPGTRIYVIPAEQVENAARLKETLQTIVDKDPQYRGPSGVTADDIRKHIKALDTAIAAANTESPTDAQAEPGRPLTGEALLFQKERVAFYETLEKKGATDACPHGQKALTVGSDATLSEHVAKWCAGNDRNSASQTGAGSH
ncbi:MAG: hypothetical protein HUU55_09680 [Myxococcales bacterium]|nr:hypothetical protein [Myxococcales bacterium]